MRHPPPCRWPVLAQRPARRSGAPNLATRSAATARGCETHPPLDGRGAQEVTLISESDVLRLVVRSRLPAADRFERWVFEEVLPQIARTGRYGQADALAALGAADPAAGLRRAGRTGTARPSGLRTSRRGAWRQNWRPKQEILPWFRSTAERRRRPAVCAPGRGGGGSISAKPRRSGDSGSPYSEVSSLASTPTIHRYSSFRISRLRGCSSPLLAPRWHLCCTTQKFMASHAIP